MNDSKGLRVHVNRSGWGSHIEFLILHRSPEGKASVGDVTMRPAEDGVSLPPTFCLDFTAAQALMDGLWQSGLRPTEGTGSAGSLAATERHLQDMRAIVSKKFDLPLL